MKITYENTFDHWVAAQVFQFEQLSSLKKYDKKKSIHLILYLLVADAFLLLTVGPDSVFKVFTLFIIFWILFYLHLQRTRMQTLICQRLKIGYGQAFEEEKDKTVQWEATPEQIIIRVANRELRLTMDSIQKITICSQYLFIVLGFNEHTYLPKQAIPEANYNAFCTYLINLYQAHAKQHQKEAIVVQSDWAIETSALRQKTSTKTSFRRILFTLLWGAVFLIIGILFFGMLTFAAMLFQTSTELLPYDKVVFSRFAAAGLLIGSAFAGFLGLILGLLGKLPGTK